MKQFVWILLIFLLSAYFRITSLDLMEFKTDEANTLNSVISFYNHPLFIQKGLVSSTGISNFPLFNYLMVIMFLFSQNPEGISFLIGLINSLMIVFFYLITKGFIDDKVALFSSLILATSPWAILFSRKIWAQDVLMFFLIPILFFLFQIIIAKKSKFSMPLFIFLTLLAQIHASGIFFMAITVAILIFSKAKINIKRAGAGIIIGLITILPYLYFELNSSPFCPDCQTLLRYGQSRVFYDPNNFFHPFEILTGSGFGFELGEDYHLFLQTIPPINNIFLLEEALTILSVIILIKERSKYSFLIYPVILIPIIYYLTKTASYMHYYVILLPFSAITLGLGLNKFLSKISLVLLILFLISNIIFVSKFNEFLRAKKDIKGDYGPIFELTRP